jgi:hypothetical protein
MLPGAAARIQMVIELPTLDRSVRRRLAPHPERNRRWGKAVNILKGAHVPVRGGLYYGALKLMGIKVR